MYNLYYSQHCQHCSRLFRECNTNGLNLININEGQYPTNIVNVPTIEDVVTNQLYIGADVFEFLKNNNMVEAFEYNTRNKMNSGFSFINTSVPKYTEQENFSHLSETN
tara:strand:- start:433 stop:756 length:324 start_codon:yes stop_codon:yes gene_type:complete